MILVEELKIGISASSAWDQISFNGLRITDKRVSIGDMLHSGSWAVDLL